MTGAAPLLFDPRQVEIHKNRMNALFAGADFLHRRAAASVAERLEEVARPFPAALIVGDGPGPAVFAEALRGVAGEARLDIAAPNASGLIDAREGVYDLAIGALSLHRANDPVGQLVQIRRALKPDALLIAQLFGGETLRELRAALAEAEVEVEGGLSPRVAPMGELRDLGGLLQRAGYAMPVADSDRVDVTYETPFGLMRDLRAMGEANALAERRRSFSRRATLLRAAEIYAAHFPAPAPAPTPAPAPANAPAPAPGGRVRATFEIVALTGWSPGPDQPKALRPGSARTRLADALGAEERPLGEKPER